MGLAYRLIKFVLKVKGIKKIFSEDPIPYKKLRKDDFFSPSKRTVRGQDFSQFSLLESEITVIKPQKENGSLVIYCPGGAFVCGPSEIAFRNIALISEKTGAVSWLVNYPKAPEHDIETIAKNIDAVYAKALTQYDASDIILLGGSAGGNLILTLSQRLIKNKIPLPSKLIPVCPVAEASFSNPEIAPLEKIDPMLSKKGVLSASKMTAMKLPLKDELLSPLYGSFDHFPETHLFAAEEDILTPDILLMYEKMKKAKVEVRLIYGKAMPHIWPFIPFMRASKKALEEIISIIKAA